MASATKHALVVASLQLFIACAGAAPPVLPGLAARRPEEVVVLVPGLTGTALRDADTGRAAWGTGLRLLLPRDGGRELALPLAEPPSPQAEQSTGGEVAVCGDRLVPAEVIEEIRLFGLLEKPVYRPVARLLAANGLPRGDLEDPAPSARFFPFAYDWRRDTVGAARLLGERLEALALRRRAARLPVALLCQSSGGQICRWLAKYGRASLEEAEAGREVPLARVSIERVILVGTANGGSLRILRELDRGRTYVPVLGRRIRPEALFTFPSLFQDLPAYRDDLLVDGEGRDLAADLFDPATWRRFGWSIHGEKAARRLLREGPSPCFGDEAARDAHLARQLDRARRFQRLLAADAPGFGRTAYHSIQSRATATPARAVVEPAGRGWRTSFGGDGRLSRRPRLRALAEAPGDGHATVASQLHVSPQEEAALAEPPLLLRGGHFEMILEPEALRRILEIVAGETGREGPRTPAGR